MSYSNLDSKAARAVAAYLISANAGQYDDVFHAYDSRDKMAFPRTLVDVGIAQTDRGEEFSGTFWIPIMVTIVGSSANPIPVKNQLVNPDAARLIFDARVAATMDALMQSDDNGASLKAMCPLITAAGRALAVPVDNSPQALQMASNNADMVDFTLVNLWTPTGFGKAEVDDPTKSWAKTLLFKGLFCAENVD